MERFNKTLCEALAKLTNENKEWDDKIPPVLFAYRSKKQSSTQIEPFYLTYGRKVTLINEDNEKETSLTEHINHIIEELPKEREHAKVRIENSQKHQKEYHDKKGKQKQNFKIGDKVLYCNAAKEKQWSGKLDEKWKGPYYIHTVLINGSYKIKEINGKVLKTPVNGEWLKIYHSRESFEPMVVII